MSEPLRTSDAGNASGLTPRERTSALSLGGIFALRMLGLFLILPVFSLWARELPGGESAAAVGFAFGVYGLTQGVLQIPFGAASDRLGRKPVIIFGLIVFVAGSVLAASADNVWTVAAARALQGAGAVSAAVTAMISDSVRDRVLTRAMAFVGASIGLTFALSLVLSPVLAHWIGVPGLFWLTAALAAAAIALMVFVVPDAPVERADATACMQASKRSTILNPQLALLNLGVFNLHMAQMALFVVVPIKLSTAGLAMPEHWTVYLPAVLASFAFMMPAIKAAEQRNATKSLFIFCIALLTAAFLGFEIGAESVVVIGVLLLVFFCGFNILEASLPSLVSRTAPASAKGLALGVYNTTQSIGLFAGGAAGGWLFGRFGETGVFCFCAALMLIWLAAARFMKIPAAHRAGQELDLKD